MIFEGEILSSPVVRILNVSFELVCFIKSSVCFYAELRGILDNIQSTLFTRARPFIENSKKFKRSPHLRTDRWESFKNLAHIFFGSFLNRVKRNEGITNQRDCFKIPLR